MLKLVIIFTFFMSLGANPAMKRASSPVQLIELEEACVRQGGVCLPIQDCDPRDLSQFRGVLCPAQKHLGVECCYT
ncbi:unnamed protein product [Pieris brassicae]|uniref:Uncharacterized protein n=1 Tax=Pieris brassicae TaxID=7116 RepID=A0A9P0TU39_PIEBR|nr:unnamed protein product [Pieris brassicae]